MGALSKRHINAYSAEPRFRVAASPGVTGHPETWLEYDGRQILAGPPAVLEQFADLLELLNPPRRMLPEVLRACISMTRGSIFTPGEELRRIGRASS